MREKLMTIDELAEMLNMTKKTIYQNVYHKRIPYISVNKKCLRFDPAAIDAWLASKSRPAQERTEKTPVRRSPGRPRKKIEAGEAARIERLIESAKAEALV
jgi:excisionase family DNA binding protein